MSDISASLIKWFGKRPQWLQIAATRLLQKAELTDEDIAEITALCRQEAGGKLPKETHSFPASAFYQGAAGTLRLCSISDVEGINALAPKKPLEFGKGNIAVVYGHNGSGKSGYVRLLKHVCGARDPGTLHSNVYKPGSAVQKACISFEKDGASKSHTWSGQGICDDLNSVDIFDTSFGKFFVSSEDEVSYEPPVLSFFSSLILVCARVAAALDTEVDRHQSKKPNIPAEKEGTPEGIWYENINANTIPQDIEEHCAFGSVNENEMQALQRRLAERAPAEKAQQLRKQKQHIDTLIQDVQKHLEQLSDENCRRIIAAKAKSILKKKAAATAAKKAFSDSELEGIGSDIWKELWEAARKYSASFAYKETEYPNVSEDSRCVLCHQTLTQEAKDRLISFEDFVKGEMQKAATEAAKEYEIASQTVEELPTLETLKTRIDAAGLSQDEVVNQVTEFFTQLQTRKDQLPDIDSEEALPASLPSQKWIEEAIAHSQSLGERAANYDEDAKSDNREDIQKKLNSLQVRKWLSEHRVAIGEEVNRLKLLAHIQKAKRSTNTQSLSLKKGELAEELITDAFVQRFNVELKALGASKVKVELVKSKVAKGRVLHKLQLRGAAQNSLTDVLSEGENRIVSIAAFLADVTGKSNQAPFIFDDPISSLDQTYEEAVVQRLIELSKDKQVIVFTHRLSLLGLIHEYAKKVDEELKIICVREESWGTGEPGDAPFFVKRPDKALNSLINDCLSKAKKLLREDGKEVYEPYAKALCRDFRILLERMIEFDLMADVVGRYRRDINTKNKIHKLARINEHDCQYFDDLMTKYSRYEHSQPLDAPVPLPEPDELQHDFNELKEWQTDFKQRPALSA